VLAVAALVVVAAPFVLPDHLFGGGQPRHSVSYQAGYTAGTSGAPHITAGTLGGNSACQMNFIGAQTSTPTLVADDYLKGCLDGLRDHPPGSP
jgi:hypothetical protein